MDHQHARRHPLGKFVPKPSRLTHLDAPGHCFLLVPNPCLYQTLKKEKEKEK
jgi:hypothetical protein